MPIRKTRDWSEPCSPPKEPDKWRRATVGIRLTGTEYRRVTLWAHRQGMKPGVAVRLWLLARIERDLTSEA